LSRGLVFVYKRQDYTRGPATAPVSIVWFSDLTSPLTPKAAEIMQALRKQYGDRLQLIFRNSPLTELRPRALQVHRAALAAGAAGRFWEMHDLIVQHPGAWDDDALAEYGAKSGASRDAVQAAVRGAAFDAQIEADLADARRRDIRGTPVFFVNGKRIDGIQSLSLFVSYIDAELATAAAEAK
jgi:protein-disulfide isomerase